MKFEIVSTPISKLKTDLLVVLLDKELEFGSMEDAQLKALLDSLRQDFEAKTVKREYFTRWSQEGIKHLVVFHSLLDSTYNIWEKVKIFSARALGYGKDLNLTNVSFLLNGEAGSTYLGKVVEGVILGRYSFEKYRKEKNKYWDRVRLALVVDNSSREISERKLSRYSLVSEMVNECREIVNEPGSVVYPEVLAELAQQIAKKYHLKATILDDKDLQKQGYMGLVSVGKGSIHPPRLISLEYNAAKKSKVKLALVGKGITFDTGGISIKPSEKMLEMKGDKAGGVAVLYTLKAIAQLRPNINVVGIIPSAENFPDANAQRPGDIFVAKNGKSVQVDNTDAEGRLVLIDAFALAGELAVTHAVDIATLTGSVVRALGQAY
ncbi:MAG: aminopeptidase, partial [Acidobacteria bacterium]